MASTVAAPLERRLGEIPGVTEITSTSSLGSTNITIQFDLGRGIDGAARDVQAALNAALTDLPGDLPTLPAMRKVNPSAAPILILALTSNTMLASNMYDVADSVIAQRIAQVEGVAEVTVNGAEQPAMRIRVNPVAVASMGVSLEDVRNAISNANAASALGTFDGPDLAHTIGSNDQLRTVPEYKNLVVKSANGTVVRLGAIADVELGVRNSRSAAWFNLQPSVLLVVTKQADANVIDTVDRIYEMLPELKRWIPADVQISVLSDRTTTIRASVRDMQSTLLATIALVMLVVFLFLRRAAATIAAGVTVPLALAGTCAAMWVAGFSIDNISLMALAVSVGFVVDDAIVVIENVFRNLEKGMTPLRATIEGARQIGFTVLSISISLVAAFTPLLVHGRAGRPAVQRILADPDLRHRDLDGGVAVADADDLRPFRQVGAEPQRHLARPRRRADSRSRGGGLCREPRRRAAPPLDHADGVPRHHRAHRRSLRQDAEGLLSAGRHRPDLRRHPRRAGYLVRSHEGVAAARHRGSCCPIRPWPMSARRSAASAAATPRSTTAGCSSA